MNYAGMKKPPRFMIANGGLQVGLYTLPAGEAHHAHHVLRMRPGQAIDLLDGRGGIARAEVEAAGGDEVVVRITQVDKEPAPRHRITIATAVPKGRRWQSLVEKCTELGVDGIVPVRFARSVAMASGNRRKWLRWSMEACKQCCRTWLPEIADPVDLEELLAHDNSDLKLLAAPDGKAISLVRKEFSTAGNMVVIVGPEGGVTAVEYDACIAAGFMPVRIAQNILRVETAAMAACAIIRGMSIA